jgi:transaldolase
MKIFLDTAHVADIKKWLATGLIDGVTTNPSLLSQHGSNPRERIAEICALMGSADVSVEVTETEAQKVYAQARAIAGLAKNVVVKIPCHIDYYPVIHQLTQEKIPLNITLVFTVLQGLMMAKLGVKYISPFVGRLDDIGGDGLLVVDELKEMLCEYDFDTQVLAASIRGVRDLHEAAMSGADVATVPVAVLEKAVAHPLTDRGMALFNNDWQKLGIKQFP